MSEIIKKWYDDFVQRLHFHNRGDGVNDHATSSPIFLVQKKELIFGIDPDYSDDGYCWVREGGDSEYNNSEIEAEIDDMREAGDPVDPYDLEEDDEIKIDGETVFRKVYYIVRWEYVSAHLTREAAKAFIERKQHDYRELRVYVDSQYHCWEYNSIIKGLLDGKIVFEEVAA